MGLLLLLVMALPQEYINLIMDGNYDGALAYCEEMVAKGKDIYTWEVERGDIYLDKLDDYGKAAEIYSDLIARYGKKDGDLHFRLALALEMKEDYLNAAKAYEIVATQYRKPPLDSFALSGVERCFKKNYQDFVASVDGYKFTRLELDEQVAKASPYAKKDEKSVLDKMIQDRLIYENAVKNEINKTEQFITGMRDKRKELLLDEVRAWDIMYKAQPTEKEMKNYYTKNKENYKWPEELKLLEIVVSSESLGQFIIDSLKKDAQSFDTLAKIYSTVPSGKKGGNVGFVRKGARPQPVDSIIFAAGLNQLLGVIPFDSSYGIYMVTEHNPERYRQFSDVNRQVEATLKTENIKKLEENFTKYLKKNARIEILDSSITDTTEAFNDKAVAVVNGRAITQKALIDWNAKQYATNRYDLSKTEDFKKLLAIITEEGLKLEHGERNKYFLHDGYIVKKQDVLRTLMESGLYRKIVIEGVTIDSQEVLTYYTEHKEDFKVPESVHCQEIVVDSLAQAEQIRKTLLKNPEQFDSLAIKYSKASSAQRGGDIGAVRQGMRSKVFENIAFKLKTGSLSKIFVDDNGKYTIIKVLEHTPASYRTYAEIEKGLASNLLRRKQVERATSYLDEIRAAADIQIFLAEPAEEQKEESPPEQVPDKVDD